MTQLQPVIVWGGGPAALAAANVCATAGRPTVLVDRDDMPGGLCRTVEFKGFLFDIGGGPFATPDDEVRRIWSDVLGEELITVRRHSSIFSRGRFFRYPLAATHTLLNLGFSESARCLASFLSSRFAKEDGLSFEARMTNRLGPRLFETFFKSYAEKLSGLPCKNLSTDWAEHSSEGVLPAGSRGFPDGPHGKAGVRGDTFLYPRTGQGEFLRRYEAHAVSAGAEMRRQRTVTRVSHRDGQVLSVALEKPNGVAAEEMAADALVSGLPLPSLVDALDPPAPSRVTDATKRLRYRNSLTVNMIIAREHLFLDQTIYVQSPEVRLARIRNHKNWTAAMVPDPRKTSLGLEYFCSEDDDFWNLPDSELVAWALSDLEQLRLGSRNDLVDAFVVREKQAFPLYELGYEAHLDVIRTYLAGFSNLWSVGRAGLFCCGSAGWAMKTGLAAGRAALGQPSEDPWSIPPLL